MQSNGTKEITIKKHALRLQYEDVHIGVCKNPAFFIWAETEKKLVEYIKKFMKDKGHENIKIKFDVPYFYKGACKIIKEQ